MASDNPSSHSQITTDGFFCVLPDEILNQILYSLTLKERAIASVVSRKWHHMIASLDDCNAVHTDSEKCLTKLCSDKSTVMQFYWFRGTIDTYLKSYHILESRLLTVLRLTRCKIQEKDFGDIIELSSLKEIYLRLVRISPTTFSRIINKSPYIVELTVKYPRYVRRPFSISVSDLEQLKKVHLEGTEFGAIQIKAQNLQEFHLFLPNCLAPIKLDLCTCTKLQVLTMDCDKYMPLEFLESIGSTLPCLKSLFLGGLYKILSKIKLWIPQLEDLTLSGFMNDCDEPNIVTPALRSLKLIPCGDLPRSCPVVGSTLMQVEIVADFPDYTLSY